MDLKIHQKRKKMKIFAIKKNDYLQPIFSIFFEKLVQRLNFLFFPCFFFYEKERKKQKILVSNRNFFLKT